MALKKKFKSFEDFSHEQDGGASAAPSADAQETSGNAADTPDTDALAFGSDDTDTLDATAGFQIFAGAGDDVIHAGADVAILDGGEGYDRVYLTGAGGFNGHNGAVGSWTGIEEVIGTARGDVINAYNPFGTEGLRIDAGAGCDTVEATAGDDVLVAGAGDDSFAGGGGIDTVVFAGLFADYTLDVHGGTVWACDMRTIAGNDGSDRLEGIEVLQFADRAVNLAGIQAGDPAAQEPLSDVPATPATDAFPIL